MNCLSIQNEVGGLCEVLESRSLPECFKEERRQGICGWQCDRQPFVGNDKLSQPVQLRLSPARYTMDPHGRSEKGSRGRTWWGWTCMWLSCNSQVGTKDPVLWIWPETYAEKLDWAGHALSWRDARLAWALSSIFSFTYNPSTGEVEVEGSVQGHLSLCGVFEGSLNYTRSCFSIQYTLKLQCLRCSIYFWAKKVGMKS